MAMLQRLEMRQGQSLVMTPQLLQAIKLLQLSHLDLAAYVEAELERNPLLERAEPEGGEGASDSGPGPFGTEAPANPQDTPGPAPLLPSLRSVGKSRDPAQEGPDPETALAQEVSLAEHLAGQLGLATRDPLQRLIGHHLIDAIDEAGYLSEAPEEIGARLGVPPDRVERVLALIHTFDPPGIGARDLAECLALQLRERNRLDPAMAALLTRLDLVARRDRPALRRLCGVDDEDLSEMLSEIRALEPKPGRAFGGAPAVVLVPDVLVRPAPDRSWLVELNPETLPRLLVNQAYHAQVAGSARREGDRAFLTECLQNAGWLTRSLDQRAKTILKVASEIVRHQDGFFRHGVAYLRPLTLKAVADEIGMHESTVSRVTANKAIGTNRGTFEMKYFFTAAIAGSAGAPAHSSEAVRHRIRLLTDGESPDEVLSDDALVELLKREGIDIARRTVAKYREALRIPSSVERRRLKQGLLRAS